MNQFDQAMINTFPLVPCLRGGQPEEATKQGIRFVVASNGIFREVDLPWIRVVHRIGNVDPAFRVPYGKQRPSVEVKCCAIPSGIIEQLHHEATLSMPNEMAAAVIWNSVTNSWRAERRKSIKASEAFVKYEEVKLGEGEYLVVDMHSHGKHHAFFSETDNKDDEGAMKFRMVIGRLDLPLHETVIELCMAGIHWIAKLDERGNLGVVN